MEKISIELTQDEWTTVLSSIKALCQYLKDDNTDVINNVRNTYDTLYNQLIEKI